MLTFVAFAHHARLAKWDREISAGIRGAIVRLPVEVLVLKEQHRIVRANRGAQQPANIERGRRHHHAQPGNVREDYFAALAMVNGTAGEVAADGNANHRRAFEVSRRAPALRGHFIAQLHHGRPDVVEELNFRNRLQPSNGHADGAPHDRSFGDRRIEHAARAVLALQARSGLEDAALPFHVGQIFDAAAVRDIFSEDYDALVAGHFVEQRGRDDFNHRFWMAVQMRLRFKLLRGGIDIGRVDIHVNRIGRRRFRRERAIGGLGNFANDVGFESF